MSVRLTDSESRSASVPPIGPGVEESWINLDGGHMRYLRAGSGPPLVLLHGLFGYSFSWRYTIPALAPYATLYAPDMLGAGFSDRPPNLDDSMRGTARRMLRFVEQLGVSAFDLLGTSHGGAVAMMAAAECVEGKSNLRVRRMVLVAPVNPFSSQGQVLAPFAGSKLGASLFRFGAEHMKFLFPYFHARLYADRRGIPPGALAGYLAQFAEPGLVDHALSIVRTWTKDLRELKSILPKLAGIPTLLMWGEKDPAVHASSARPLAKYFSNSTLVLFPGVGHLPYEECPREFNHALIEYLTREKFPA